MTFQLVSLLCALILAAVGCDGQGPKLGGFGHFGTMSGALGLGPTMGGLPYLKNSYARGQVGGINSGSYQQMQTPHLLTCINAEVDDLQSQIRVTLKPLNSRSRRGGRMGFGGGPNFGFGFDDFNDFNDRDDDVPDDWTVDGVLLPGQLQQAVGSYQLAVFEGGRTYGKCQMSALGQVLNTGGNNLGGMFRGGPFGSMFGGHAYAPQQANGLLSNNAVVSTGTTMYSGLIRGMTFNQLVGRSLAACQTIQGGQCMGEIRFCCSIVRDSLSASDVFIDPVQGGYNSMGNNGFMGGVTQGGVGGIGGGVLPVGGAGTIPLTNTGALTGRVGVGGSSLF